MSGAGIMSTRTLITRVAAQLFAERGYGAVSMREIAEKVGVTREALYHHFKNKAQILYEILEPSSTRMHEDLREVMAGPESSVEKLVRAIDGHLAHFNPDFVELSVSVKDLALRSGDRPLKRVYTTWHVYSNLWVDLVADAQREGLIRQDADPRITAYGILGMLNSLSNWFKPGGSMTIEDVRRNWTDMVLGGVLSETGRNQLKDHASRVA